MEGLLTIPHSVCEQRTTSHMRHANKRVSDGRGREEDSLKYIGTVQYHFDMCVHAERSHHADHTDADRRQPDANDSLLQGGCVDGHKVEGWADDSCEAIGCDEDHRRVEKEGENVVNGTENHVGVCECLRRNESVVAHHNMEDDEEKVDHFGATQVQEDDGLFEQL